MIESKRMLLFLPKARMMWLSEFCHRAYPKSDCEPDQLLHRKCIVAEPFRISTYERNEERLIDTILADTSAKENRVHLPNVNKTVFDKSSHHCYTFVV